MGDPHIYSEPEIAIPKYGLKVKLNHEYPERRNPYYKPSLKIIWTLLPLLLRYVWYYIVSKIKGKSVVMDYIVMKIAKRIYGVPIGGIGSGTIGRGFKGEFCRFQLRPNVVEYNTVDANDFIVTIKNGSKETIFQSSLSTYRKTSLSSWKSRLDASKCSYTGLYPRAWTEYDLSEYGILLTCRQVSPVIPHDYESSSLPCALFIWTAENISKEQRTVSVAFMFKNGTGTRKYDRQSTCSSKAFSYQSAEGVILYHTLDKIRCSYSLAVKVNNEVKVSRCLHFDPNSDGSSVWNQLKNNGHFAQTSANSHKNHTFGEMGVGVAAKVKIDSGNSKNIEMVLVWDMPSVIYRLSEEKYYRYYTERFGKENAALKIVDFAFQNYSKWEKQIYDWQKPVLEDRDLPDWYKSALFNETYFISDGGTIWLSLDDDSKKKLSGTDPRKTYGRFAYLEGHEYRMYNSYDVHFYASHALSKNWPELQKCLQYDFRDFVSLEVPEKVWILSDGQMVERKKPDTVPHDAGDPGESPFSLVNAYPIYDVSNWRDLGVKYVLQTYRDATVAGSLDIKLVQDLYNSCDVIMRKTLLYDEDDDGLIENSGEPDQTFDTWVMVGASSYCGGLWLAALYVMIKMATGLNKPEDVNFYDKIFTKGVKSFHKKLWNGKYYNFDCSTTQCNSIMADQLNGQWYLGCSGEGKNYPIFPKVNVQSALQSIYENNVLCFCEGNMGAVNGFKDGQVDNFTLQSLEVWTGVTYALAATMIQEGMIEEAFKTAGGMFQSMTNQFGLIFDTPEAIYSHSHYRSIGYMRPLSIWSMQIAWEARKRSKN